MSRIYTPAPTILLAHEKLISKERGQVVEQTSKSNFMLNRNEVAMKLEPGLEQEKSTTTQCRIYTSAATIKIKVYYNR